VSITSWIHYFKESKRLERKNELLCASPYNCGKWLQLKIGILLEYLKKQHLNLKQIENGFTFYGNKMLMEIDPTDIPWQAFEYDKIDMKYDNFYNEIKIFESNIFFLFKDSTFVDYRYDGDRDFLIEYLKSGGDILMED
jgi:hypothetical protein